MFGIIGGLTEFRASLLASHGFAVLALAYFAYEGLPDKLLETDLEYFEEAADFLLAHPKVVKILFHSSHKIIGQKNHKCLVESVQPWAEHSLHFKNDRRVGLLSNSRLQAHRRQ